MSAHELTTTHYCKQPGCDAEARSSVGRYSYCDYHGELRAKAAAAGQLRPGSKPGPKAAGEFEQKVNELKRLARDRDRLYRLAESATRKALAAKKAADDAAEAFKQAARDLTSDES